MGQHRKSNHLKSRYRQGYESYLQGKSLAVHVNLAADDVIYRANRGGLECQITLLISIKCRKPIR